MAKPKSRAAAPTTSGHMLGSGRWTSAVFAVFAVFLIHARCLLEGDP